MLTVAVVVVATVAVLNLTLTLALIRKMRESGMWSQEPFGPTPGTTVSEFAVSTVDGDTLRRGDFAEGSRFAIFLSPGCEPCRQLVASVEAGRSLPERAVAVITQEAHGDATTEFAGQVRRLLPTVIDEVGQMSQAFPVNAYPTVVLVTDGIVAAAAHNLDEVLADHLADRPVPQPA